MQERGHRGSFLGDLIHHDAHAHTAIWVAAAAQLTPIRTGSVYVIGPVGEGAHEREREPVACRLAETRLILHVVSEMRQGVALCRTALVGDCFVAARERNRLERAERDDPRI